MKLLIVFFMFNFLYGCTNIEPYRTHFTSHESCESIADIACENGAYYRQATKKQLGYDIPIGIIEFDDQGSLMRPSFKNKFLEKLRGIANENPVLMVVFAHGWKNNASINNQNLRDFQAMLFKLAQLDKIMCVSSKSCMDRQVVGVYLGWRGLSATMEPFRTLSFWNRKERARRVGQDGATEFLAELAKIKAQKASGKRDSYSKLIAVGHSFGGALLFAALQPQLVRDTAFSQNNGTIYRNAAQLIVLVNPAFEAARLTPLHDKAAALNFNEKQRPILAIFTSEKDTATKYAFPAGRYVSTLFTRYNPERQEQFIQDKKAVGHYQPYQTHSLVRRNKDSKFSLFSDAVCRWKSYQTGNSDEWDIGAVQLTRLEKTMPFGQKNNPYLNVVVDNELISDHNKIWGNSFMDFLYRFVAVQDARDYRHCS